MTNEPEWEKEFEKYWIYFCQYYPEKEKGLFGNIKSFIKEEKEKSYREGQRSLDAHILCRKEEIENIAKDKSELLSKIEEEVNDCFWECQMHGKAIFKLAVDCDDCREALVVNQILKDVKSILSKYKVNK